ncbi:MAG: hypothetical protein FJ137_20385, partial [Deltaproteobacteria bacterium]|nr:hypothetical protein [Deltaproteobacteria bacterium]
ANGVVAQSLSLQGPDGSADVFVLDNEDAGTVAARVDVVAGDTGITAVAATQLLLTAAAPAAGGVATGSFALSTRTAGVQGAVAVVAATIGTGGDLKAMASRVNAWIDTTGVSARLGDATNELVLRAAGGADIVVGDVITTDASGSATLLSATGLRDDGRGGLVATGAAVALPANAGVAVGGAVLLSAAGPLSVRTTAPGSLFAAATTDGEATSVASLALSTTGAAAAAVAVVDDALDAVAAERALLGGFQNRLDATIASLESTLDNVGAARARITDVDVAAELASVARSRVLSEAGVSLLAQANQSPRLALRLLTAPSAA